MKPTDSSNSDQFWKIKVGQAGNIYSLETAVGETVPPQEHDNAPWVDEVWQSVSVDGSENVVDNTCFDSPWFIHEAGTYIYDSSCSIEPTSGQDEVEVPYTDTNLPTPTLNSYALTRSSSLCVEQATLNRFNCPLDGSTDLGNSPNNGNTANYLAKIRGTGVDEANSIVVSFLHYAFSGSSMYFYKTNPTSSPTDTWTLAEVNAALPVNQTIDFYAYPPKLAEEVMGGPAMGGFDGAIDLQDQPFYSPSLGSHCDDETGECYFMSWVSTGRFVVGLLCFFFP